jgi:lipopolysaccharide biosynthesis glycosyltransferase
MYNISMTQPVAAVRQEDTFDNYEKFVGYIPEQYHKKFLSSAGIFVADLARWRKLNVTGMLEDQATSMLTFGQGLDDQLVLNMAFPETMDQLDPRWNTELFGFYVSCPSDDSAFILHWSGPYKAWAECRESCLPFDIWMPQPRCGPVGSAGLERVKPPAPVSPKLPSEVYASTLLASTSTRAWSTPAVGSTSGVLDDVVHVVYATTVDNSSGPGDEGLLASMLSVSHGLHAPGRCVIHLIVPSAHLGAARDLVACFEHQFSPFEAHPNVSLHAVQPPTSNTSAVAAQLARFYLPEYLPGVERVIWLDTDTIVQGDLTGLYNVSLSHPVAALELEDLFTAKVWFYDVIPMKVRQLHMFDAGVFVADLGRWRQQNASSALEEKARAMLAAGKGWDDELVMNLVFADNMDRLDATLIHGDLGSKTECKEDPEALVMHWSGPLKAWSECRDSCSPYDTWKPQLQCAH